MYYKKGMNSDALVFREEAMKKLKKQDDKNIARNEKKYAGELHMSGRNSVFRLILESKKFSEQELPSIGAFEDITKTYHFIEGVKRGLFMYEKGIIPEEYKERYQTLQENGLLNLMYQNAIEYLTGYGIVLDETKSDKKHR